MIEQQIFAQGMGQLAGAFGREIDGPVSKMYFGILSPALTTEQFVHAVTVTIASERFWPSPAVLLEKAGADMGYRAEAAFKAMQEIVSSHGGFRFIPFAVFNAFDDATKAGIKAVGGLAEIANTTQDRWPKMVQRFCRAYAQAAQPQAALPATIRDKQLPPGDRSDAA